MMDRPDRTFSDDPVVIKNFEDASAILKEKGFTTHVETLLRKNVLIGDPQSMVLLGLLYVDGTPEQKEKSVHLFQEAADLGNTSGMRNLAYCYAVGVNIPKDKTAAAILYKEAADLGNAGAACNYGVMLDFGNGVEQNYGLAFRYYQIAAAGGNKRGMTNLAEFYNYGKGTRQDLDAAEKWYKESGSPRANHRLGVLYLDYPEKTNREEGLKYLRLSSDAGYVKATMRLAEEVGGDEAVALYTFAARKGNLEAGAKLRSMGLPVPEADLAWRRHK